MSEVEKVRKPPKKHTPSRSVGQEPPLCADSAKTRAKSPVTTLASSSSKFNTRATNTSCGLGWVAGGHLPENEVKLEFADIEEKAGGSRKISASNSQKKSERELPLQRKRPRSLPRALSVPSPDQAFLEEQEEGPLGLHVCNKKRRAYSLERPGLHPAVSGANCHASPGQDKNKPKGDPGPCGLKSVLGQEPPVQPRKKVSKQKARGRRKEGEQAARTSRDPVLSSGQAPSSLVLVQTSSPDRREVGQPGENEEVRQTDVLIARLAREVRHLKKWKKRHLLPGVGEQPPLLSLQRPLCPKKLVSTAGVEAKGWAPGPPPGPLDTMGQKPTPDLRRFFTVNYRNICRVTCTLCHASIRQGKVKGQSQPSGLVRHLASKHGLDVGRKPTAAGPGRERGGAEKKQKGLPAGAAGQVSEGLPSPRRCPDASPPEDGEGQAAPGRPEQLVQDLPPLPTPTRDKPTAAPVAGGEDQGGLYAPNQPRAQAWNHSIAELLCSLALPLSFVSSPPFRRFMAQVDPCYHLPPPAFFSGKALPLLYEAMGEQVRQEMRWAKGGCVHLSVSVAAQDTVVDYVAITAHWGMTRPGSQQVGSGSPRKQAVLWVWGLPLESALEDRQWELREQLSLWLSHGSLRPGFLVAGGCPSLEQAVRTEGYIPVPCFVHCLDSLVGSFLCHHHSVQIILGTARAICSHFQGSAEARRLLSRLQRRCGLPAHQPFWELSDHWVSAYHLMEWLVEQQRPLQEYEEKHQLGKAGTALSAMFWSLTDSLVQLLRPFQMVVREASTTQASLSLVLPQLRYLHIFLEQVRGYFEEQSAGEMGAAVRLAEGLALQLTTDGQLTELFHREEFVLATLLDPRFKGRIEAILPAGADIDHWKQVLVYKVKEIMVSEYSLPPSPSLQSPRAVRADAALSGRVAKSSGAEGKDQEDPVQRGSASESLLFGQREKSLLEQLESVGLLASRRSGASLSMENHQASVIVKKYLRENEVVGAQEDPLAYWEKRWDVWPALARLATIYLSCPPTGTFSASVLASLGSRTITEHDPPLPVDAIQHLLFLKTNLENFPSYTPPPLIFPSGDLADVEQTSEPDRTV
ncbi:zinc finger, BED domain containing 4-like protein [Camelus ferus]|nr:zinc finger, BED domain containing 4-like protein [Camelus ferus]